MATYNTIDLLEQLKTEVKTVLATVAEINATLDAKTLNLQPEVGKWCIAQVVEHLNTYNRYYLPVIAVAIKGAGKPVEIFKPGWLGQYFTNAMYSEVVTARQVKNKMSAMKGHIPDVNLDAVRVMSEFVASEKELLRLLDDAKRADIGGARVPITLSKWIKIKVGDALRFLVAHQVRHLLQINNTLKVVAPQTGQSHVG